jgi:hypothetical protein
MKRIKNFFSFFDINGEHISLNIKGKSQSNTAIGGIFTILAIAMILIATWLTGNDIIYKTQPLTDLEDQLFKQRPFIYLDKYTFPISFCLQDNYQNTYNVPKYIKYDLVNMKIYSTNATVETTPIESENCTYEHFPNMLKDDIDKSGIINYQCLKNQNITIGGFYDNPIVQLALFRIRLCNNETDGGICAPIEEINQFIGTKVLAWNVYFQNTIINPKDYANPSQPYILNQYKIIKESAFKNFNIYVRRQEIETDHGIIFNAPETEITYAFDGSDVDEADAVPDSMIDINFMVANHGPILHRRYLKIPTIVANIGGLANLLLLLFM